MGHVGGCRTQHRQKPIKHGNKNSQYEASTCCIAEASYHRMHMWSCSVLKKFNSPKNKALFLIRDAQNQTLKKNCDFYFSFHDLRIRSAEMLGLRISPTNSTFSVVLPSPPS